MFLASGLAFTLMTCLIPVLFFVVSLAGFVLSRRAAAEVVLTQLSEIVPVYKDELHKSSRRSSGGAACPASSARWCS